MFICLLACKSFFKSPLNGSYCKWPVRMLRIRITGESRKQCGKFLYSKIFAQISDNPSEQK